MKKDPGMAKTGTSGNEDGKRNTSLRLSGKTLKALKMRALEDDSSVQRIVEALIEAYLEQPRKPNP